MLFAFLLVTVFGWIPGKVPLRKVVYGGLYETKFIVYCHTTGFFRPLVGLFSGETLLEAIFMR